MSRRSVLIGALVLSVAINLLIGGVVIGKLSGRLPGPPPGAWAARDLSPETRRLVRQRMLREMESVRPMRAELSDVRGAIRAATLRDDFDPEALRVALARLRSVTNRYQELLHENLVEVAGELAPEERSALVRAALDRARAGAPGDRRPPPEGRPGLPRTEGGPPRSRGS